ncbi:glycosyltransferase family 2 protein [Agarivorans sp. JK6]|uniref:glycosyltransferase family 2 protein n=1 Tax=Agarivorans sp. JK6 TaxID=2997426 RepID=UPI003873BB06
MNLEPLVSIVMPVYNAGGYLKETIESVLNQSYSNYELILVDNGSTDNSVSVAKGFSNQINMKIVTLETNSGGPARPRNVGMENSNGKYIAFLDSDDVWSSDKLDNQIGFMERNASNFTCTSRFLIDKDSKRKNRFIDKLFPSKYGQYGLKQLLVRNDITTSSVVVSRELVKDFSFSELSFLKCVEDYYLWLSLISDDKCVFFHLKDKCVSYRCFGDSLSMQDSRYMLLSKSLLASFLLFVEKKDFRYVFFSLSSHFLRMIFLRFKA